MGRFLVRFEHDGEEVFFDWSTVVDAPISYALHGREALEAYVRAEYGEEGVRELPGRMERIESRGTSAYLHTTPEELLEWNRAGPDETIADLATLIARYCPPTGESE